MDEFKPERWLSTSSSELNPLSSPAIYAGGGQTVDAISFLPFSTGVRSCIGMNMALLEIRLTLAQLIRRSSFRFVDERMADESYALKSGLTLYPKDKLPVYITKRAGELSGHYAFTRRRLISLINCSKFETLLRFIFN